MGVVKNVLYDIIGGRGNSESNENIRGGIGKLVDKIRIDNK